MHEDYFKESFNTPLSKQEQKDFDSFCDLALETHGKNIKADLPWYDMQGWRKDIGRIEGLGESGAHFPDTYKKPSHPTFSTESKYHGAPSPYDGQPWLGGEWTTVQGIEAFRPSQHQLEHNMPADQLKRYFEAGYAPNAIILPPYKNDKTEKMPLF